MTPNTQEATNLSDVLRVRCTPELKQRLALVASRNPVSRELSDHIRLAIEEYVKRNEVMTETSIEFPN
jgi:predicted transcriptional regulator